MALAKLADIYIRELFDRAALEQSLRKSVMFGTGAIGVDSDLAGKVAANDGTTFTSKFYRDLTDDEPTYIDDSDDEIVPDKIAIGDYTARKVMVAKAWGEKDVVKLVGFMPDPLGVISTRVAAWWGRYYDRYALASLNGVIRNNIANDNTDMGIDITAEAALPDRVINPDSIIDTIATSGDHFEDYTSFICHSKIAAVLRKANLIATIPGSDGKVIFQYYQHLRMIVTDSILTSGAGAGADYHTYFMKGPVMGWGSSNNGLIPSEIDRNARTGRGGGESMLITRRQFAMHPMGHSFQADPGNNDPSPNLADMEKPENWGRVVTERKAIPFAYLLSKAQAA